MTRKTENSARGRQAKKLSDGLFKRGIIVGNRHADPAREAELGHRAKNEQDMENNKGWGGWIGRGAISGRGRH